MIGPSAFGEGKLSQSYAFLSRVISRFSQIRQRQFFEKFPSLNRRCPFFDRRTIAFGQLSHFSGHSLPIEKVHSFELDLHFLLPPLGRTGACYVAELFLRRVVGAAGLLVMALSIVTESGLAKKTRSPNRVGIRNKRSCAIVCHSRLHLLTHECEHIAQSLV